MAANSDNPADIVECLKRSIMRMREIARTNADDLGSEIAQFAEQIARDAIELEADLIEVGSLPKPANEH